MRLIPRPPALHALLLGVAALLAAPTSGFGQQLGTGCDPISWRVQSTNTIGGFAVTWIGGPVLVCPDGTRIQADSAVTYEQSGMSELIGRVRIDHPERTLRAVRVDYYEREERLFATGSVEFRDLTNGNTISGETLQLFEAGRFRLEQEVIVDGAPARAVIAPAPEAGGSTDAEPYTILARRIHFQGERYFRAEREAVVLRDSLEARADSLITYDEQSGNLVLFGGAEVVRAGIEMAAPRISLILPEGELRSVELFGGGRILTGEREAVGDEIRLLIANEEIERLVTVRRADPTLPETRPRPQLLAESLNVIGDSVDIESPGGILARLSAEGNARVEMRAPGSEGAASVSGDSLEAQPSSEAAGSAGPTLRELPVEDWITGNRIDATFIPTPPVPLALDSTAAPGDSVAVAPGSTPPSAGEEGPGYLLDRLIAVGNASSWYRVPPEGIETEGADRRGWGVSYTLADEISIYMREGEVDWIEWIGSLRGWQIEPEDSAPAAEEPASLEEDE